MKSYETKRVWTDKRVWRGYQRQVARDILLEYIDELSRRLDITPANLVRVEELKSIAAAIKRRRLAKGRKVK
jgi:hypothetical protein